MLRAKPCSLLASLLAYGVAIGLGLAGAIGPAKATLVGVDIPAITSAGKSSNDDVGLTVSYLRTFFDNPNIVYLGSIDGGGDDAPTPPPGESITGTSGGLSGTGKSGLDLVFAFDVKAANDNALESVVSPALSGTAVNSLAKVISISSALRRRLGDRLIHPLCRSPPA